jgi:hypothetical protein
MVAEMSMAIEVATSIECTDIGHVSFCSSKVTAGTLFQSIKLPLGGRHERNTFWDPNEKTQSSKLGTVNMQYAKVVLELGILYR